MMNSKTKFSIGLSAIFLMLLLASEAYACESWGDQGVVEICSYQSDLVIPAQSYPYQMPFTSEDGGQTWEVSKRVRFPLTSEMECSKSANILITPNPDIQYRWQQDDFIERSTDGGRTWVKEYDLSETRKTIHDYYYGLHNGRFCGRIVEISQTPLGGFYDSATGNVIFAMGWHGVLVRLPDGNYSWSAVGDDYRINELLNFNNLAKSLYFDLLLAMMLTFLFLSTVWAYIHLPYCLNILPFGWLGWLFLFLALSENLPSRNAERPLKYFLLGIVIFAGCILLIGVAWLLEIYRNSRQPVWKILLVSFLIGLLYFIPLFLWSQGIIFDYTIAHFAGIFLALSFMIALGYFWFRQGGFRFWVREGQSAIE